MRAQKSFTPRISSVVWGIAFVIFGVCSAVVFTVGRQTIEATRLRAQEDLLNLQTLNAYRGMMDLNFEGSVPALDQLEERARIAAGEAERADAREHATALVAAIEAYRIAPGASEAAAVEYALRRCISISESRASESIRRQISGSQFWVWRFWGIWLASATLIWLLTSLMVWWWVRPVRKLERGIWALQPTATADWSDQQALPLKQGLAIIPREVASLRESVLSLLRRVAMAREEDFRSLFFQKNKAEAMSQALKESEQSKSHFLGLLSHEIRTPVTSLVMATRLLQRSVDSFESPIHRKLIATSARDVERLRELLDDLLSISRFDADQLALVRRPTDMKRLLRSTQESFHGEAQHRSVRLSTEFGDGPWNAEVDGPKIGWALSNLTLHSIRHTSRGGEVLVRMIRTRSATGSGFIEFRIRDSSPGIQPDKISRVMDPFGGSYELTVGRSEATGSALAIARSIAEAHGGSLMLCSEPGTGCEYQMRIPEAGSDAISNERKTDGKAIGSG